MEANQILLHSSCEETRGNNIRVLSSAVLNSTFNSIVYGTYWIPIHSDVSDGLVSDHWDSARESKGLS